MLRWKDFILPYGSRKVVTEILWVVALLLSLFIICS